MKIFVSLIVFLFVSFNSFGQQLTYKPVNPAFGGNTFNYSWLLNSANSQNSFEDPNLKDDNRSGISQFSDNLNKQLLGQLSRTLLNSQIGDGLEPGSFVFGDLAIEVIETAEGLVINILDTTTGEQTQVIIPN